MTLNALEFWRKAVPFIISFVCLVPWMALRAQSTAECALIGVLALAAGFLYMILGLREPMWQREKNRYVNAQIRDNLITLIPENVQVTAEERQQLANSQILGDLGGIFWSTIDQNELLRSHKQHFYSNGFAYTTALDGLLLCWFFAFFYVAGWLILNDPRLLICGAALAVVSALCLWWGLPARRQHHLALSCEQLNLLREQQGDVIGDRFRKIVLGWREHGRPVGVVSPTSSKYSTLWKGLAATACFGAFIWFLSRGWFGPGPGVKLRPEVKSAYITEGSHKRFAVVVFVHGIFGTKDDTWLSENRDVTFPGLLATDAEIKDKVDVFAFEYFTPKFGAAPSLVDLADQLRGDLSDHRVFDDHQRVVFLAHSMGGLVVREYLLGNQERIDKVPMIFFYATPTNGAEMAKVGELASINPQLRGMVPIEGNDLLQSIQSRWMNSTKARSIASHCGVEELPTLGIMIVTRSSATSLCNQPLDPFSASHIEIVKPPNRDDSRYTRFVSALKKEVLTADSAEPSHTQPPPRAPSKPTLVVDTIVDEPTKVALEIRNTGRGVAHVHAMRTFVSGNYIPDGGNPDHGIPVVKALGLHSDIHWRYPGDQGYEIPPGGVTAIWWVNDMSDRTVEDFKSLIRGLALEVCYCSDQGECQWMGFRRTAPEGNCNSSLETVKPRK